MSARKEQLPIGFTSGHLTVVGAGEPIFKDGHYHTSSVVKCECGNQLTVMDSLLRKGVRRFCSCSCALRNRKHGESRSRLYRIWLNMCHRCRSNRPEYTEYFGRGIRVCEEWQDYKKFREWALANGYAENLSIDRINVNGNYSPSNCRWTDCKTQSANRRCSRNITYKGETKNIAEWARITGINRGIIHHRIFELGWSVEESLETKPMKKQRKGTH